RERRAARCGVPRADRAAQPARRLSRSGARRHLPRGLVHLDLDRDVDAVAHTLADDAEILEHIEAAADPVDRRWVDRGDQPDAQRADAQPAALVAHERALDARGQVVHVDACAVEAVAQARTQDRKSTRLNSSHVKISYAVFHLTKKMQ